MTLGAFQGEPGYFRWVSGVSKAFQRVSGGRKDVSEGLRGGSQRFSGGFRGFLWCFRGCEGRIMRSQEGFMAI